MAGKKIMLWPSARSKFVKDGNMKMIQIALLVLTVFIALQYYYLFAFMYAVKLVLMVLISVVVTRETEILFYAHDKEIGRAEAKGLIKKSYPEITAMIYALLIPVGTPLWLVGLGAVLATLLGKLLFGGFHHMVFHTSLVGVIVVTLGWTQIVDGVAFMTSFDNFLLELMFDNSFFNNTLAIGGTYDPSALGALSLLAEGNMYPIGELFIGLSPGVIASAMILLLVLIYFIVNKVVDWTIPVIATGTLLITAWLAAASGQIAFTYFMTIIGTVAVIAIFYVLTKNKILSWKVPAIIAGVFVVLWIFGVIVPTFFTVAMFQLIGESFINIGTIGTLFQSDYLLYALYHLFSGSFLFIAVFVMTDPITTPLPLKGKIIFAIIVGSLTVFIRLANVYEEGVVFAVLFMNMLTPLLNEVLKEKRKAPVKKAPVKKAGASE